MIVKDRRGEIYRQREESEKRWDGCRKRHLKRAGEREKDGKEI